MVPLRRQLIVLLCLLLPGQSGKTEDRGVSLEPFRELLQAADRNEDGMLSYSEVSNFNLEQCAKKNFRNVYALAFVQTLGARTSEPKNHFNALNEIQVSMSQLVMEACSGLDSLEVVTPLNEPVKLSPVDLVESASKLIPE